MTSRYALLSFLLASYFACAQLQGQEPAGSKSTTVKLRVFDAFRPAEEVTPVEAFIFIRKEGEVEEKFYDRQPIGKRDDKGLYSLTVPSGTLIHRISISTTKGGVKFNSAAITKIVGANEMTIYPGASSPREEFSFSAYCCFTLVTFACHNLMPLGQIRVGIRSSP